MSFLSRLFRKPAPAPAPPPVRPTAAPPASAPRRDVVELAREEEARVSEALAAGDTAAVARWVLDGSSSRVRQAAARAVADPEHLNRLIPAVRGKDKTVYRILTAKRDELHAAELAARRRAAEVAEAGAAIARHADRSFDASYASTLARLEARWTAAEPEATEDLRRDVARHIARSHDVIEARRLALEADAERQRAAALAAEEATRQREHEAQQSSAAAQERAQRLEEERQAERAKHAAHDAAVRELVGLLRQAQAALDHGATARATRLRDTLREKQPLVSGAMPPWFERTLQEVDARIDELKDWKTFTVVPKRAELVRRMESLVGADMSAEELARQIRRLRDEWRTLHRGGAEEPTEDREHFERAAERAYEPCREHFARQADQRRANQAHREGLIERLQAFAAEQAGDAPDWRAVQRVLVEARREWREHAPVDQAVVKPLQARFHAALEALQARLDAHYAGNAEAKRALIVRAAELAQLDDTRRAIDEVRGLQHEWKSAGFVPRHQDDALWSEFRMHCDAVFERSSQERESRDAEREANQSRALALCDEVERLGDAVAVDPGAALRRLAELRQEFEALELPRAAVRDVRQRFGRAAGHCDDAILRQRNAAARQAWAGLFTAANEVRAYALGVARGVPDADCEALHATATAAIANLQHAPKGARGVLEQQMAEAAAGRTSVDLGANEASLRLLCVRGELAAGLETPEEDMELRREHQMQRLVESMGRGGNSTPAEMEDLVFEWLAVGPVDAGVHAALLARFQRCFDTG